MLCPTCAAPNPDGSTSCTSCGCALTPASPDSASALYSPALPERTSLAGGHYTIDAALGQGGFGITYRGSDATLRRPVAIKEFFPLGCARQRLSVQPTAAVAGGEFEGIKARFLEEARTLARFSHAGIVRVFATFEENNTAYMVMEFLQGQTLQQVLDARGILDEREAIALAEKVGSALEAVHHASLIHRDIKPDNIMLTGDGRVVLIDFGTARQFAAQQTVRQTAMITPGYAPLEQYGSMARFGIYSDIYALGATLYHCLSGHLPPQATDRAAGIELIPAHELNPRLSHTVSHALSWALQLKVGERPQSVREFLAALHGEAPPQSQQLQQLQQSQAAPPALAARGEAFQPAPQVLGGLGSLGSQGVWVQRISGSQLLSNASVDSILSALHGAFRFRGAHGLSFGADKMSVLGILGAGGLGAGGQGHEIVGQVTPGAMGQVVAVGSRMAWHGGEAGPLREPIEGILSDVEQALRLGHTESFPGWPQQPIQSQIQAYPQTFPPQTPQRPAPPLPSARSYPGGPGPGESGLGLRVNSSGDPNAVLPPELRGFNLGACLMNWIWAFGNGQPGLGFGMLATCWMPFFAFIFALYLGANGNELAWRGRAWESIEEFRDAQRTWALWGLGLIAILGVLLALLAI